MAGGRSIYPRLVFGVALWVLTTQATFAIGTTKLLLAPTTKQGIDQNFPTDPFVRRQVRFWESVFQKYKSNSVIIHDVDDPICMIDVIDFGHYLTTSGQITSIEDSDQTKLVKRYIDRYHVAVERFAKLKDQALKFGAIEQRVFDVYNREPQLLARLYSGTVRFRGQGGLADTFLTAATHAQEYMPYMEQTFKHYGLPVQLSRLPFVESMFNVNAKSKVGASGIWQFMPVTAKEYMHVGPLVDERNNPYKATKGAAQLFLANYKELGSWPLAVTAYNHGRGGMTRASKSLGTSQLGQIINSYRSPSFGFASKNFYAEFLAAARTYDLMHNSGMIKPLPIQPKIEVISLNRSLSPLEVSKISNVSLPELAKFNLCLTTAALTTKSTTPLPQFYELRLPAVNIQKLKKTMASLSPKTSPKPVRRLIK